MRTYRLFLSTLALSWLIGHRPSLEDPHHPGQFNFAENGAYRCNAASSLLGAWDVYTALKAGLSSSATTALDPDGSYSTV